jgi:hypothetical protein
MLLAYLATLDGCQLHRVLCIEGSVSALAELMQRQVLADTTMRGMSLPSARRYGRTGRRCDTRRAAMPRASPMQNMQVYADGRRLRL